MIDVYCEAKTYPDRDNEEAVKIRVRSHGLYDDRVYLKIDNGPEVCVIGRDVIAAVENAMRTRR